jgi:hypothetical protein
MPRLIDIIIRGIALISLIPLGMMGLFLSIMSTDSPQNGTLPAFLVLGITGLLSLLILCSIFKPEALSKPFAILGKISFAIGRMPAYLCSLFGLYYGLTILKNSHWW